MDDLSVKVRLRPIRFAFVVSPEDRANLRRIIYANTCLWGGMYNPIVPYFKRVPAWWDRHDLRFENAKQIVNGYLDFFEPDLIVEATKGIATGFGIDPKRIISLSDLLPRSDRRDDKGLGQTVFDLYRKLYKEEFQFVRRHKHNIVSVRVLDHAFDNFSACLFGGFPRQSCLRYFSTGFSEAFDPKEIILNPDSFKKLHKSGFLSALHIGSRGLEVDYNEHSSPTLFILDAKEPRDLLDFWNYRAIHRDGIAIPVQWLQELSDFCRKLIVRNHRPLPGNPNGVMISPVSMFSRSIPESDIESLYSKYLKVEKQGANVLQNWYPPIWRPSPEFTVRQARPTITAVEKTFRVSVDLDNPYIRFDSLAPEFAPRFGSEVRWANVIRLSDYSYKDRIATVFPTDFREPAIPRIGLGNDHVLSTNEGLITFPRYRDTPHSWKLMEGRGAIEQWLKKAGVTFKLSESGRATQQVIQTLGGFSGVRSIAYKGIVDLLDGMARSPISRSAHHQKLENQIAIALKGAKWPTNVLDTLVTHKAVELGYELKCSKCGNWSWYPIQQLNDFMTCDLCLQKYPFPMTSPTNSKHARWAYRVVGPFALSKYAAGGYAAALAIRFFSEIIGRFDRSETAWSPSQELTFQNHEKIEVDFILWYQRKQLFGTDHPTEIVFGEAKSFGLDAFKDEDIQRMKALSDKYPGATLIFATMKEAADLSKDEVRRIRRLAEWGREYDRTRRQTRAPVVILTGTELFTPYHLEETWKEKGGKHANIIGPGYVRIDNLGTLADLTQQLYLDMPSYSEWWNAKWEKKRRRRAKK